MDKKLKMWIAVGVVVILVVISGILYIIWLPKDDPEYKAEITMDISENETAWIINVTYISKKNLETNEKNEPVINPSYIGMNIFRSKEVKINNIRFHAPNTFEIYGIKWDDEDNDEYFSVGDKIILNKSGGTEYIPHESDRIYLFSTAYHHLRIESNTIELI